MHQKKSKDNYKPLENALPLEVRSLYKKYSPVKDFAISNISFTCGHSEIVGLLGPNGAGKSTTIKSITGMIPFEQGEISIAGYNIHDNPIPAKYNFGFVTDNHSVFVKMTGIQYINFMADIFGVPKEIRAERLSMLEDVFKLGDAINSLISSYSHGMKQKICMMGSLIHNPPLWILDEPMLGLDPITQNAVETFMRKYVENGNTILFSSHNLDAVERICDRVIIINKGKIIKTLTRADYEHDGHQVLQKYFLQENENGKTED